MGKCELCGKGAVVEKEGKNHTAIVAGVKMTIPEAIVGRCDTCGQINYAFRKGVLHLEEIDEGTG